MLLSADCFGSGAIVGSSRIVADSSGLGGAPGAGATVFDAAGSAGVGVGVAARIVTIAAPVHNSTADVSIAVVRRSFFIALSLCYSMQLILDRAVEACGRCHGALERNEPFLADLYAMLCR
jgi:hypothetical protein